MPAQVDRSVFKHDVIPVHVIPVPRQADQSVQPTSTEVLETADSDNTQQTTFDELMERAESFIKNTKEGYAEIDNRKGAVAIGWKETTQADYQELMEELRNAIGGQNNFAKSKPQLQQSLSLEGKAIEMCRLMQELGLFSADLAPDCTNPLAPLPNGQSQADSGTASGMASGQPQAVAYASGTAFTGLGLQLVVAFAVCLLGYNAIDVVNKKLLQAEEKNAQGQTGNVAMAVAFAVMVVVVVIMVLLLFAKAQRR